MKGSEGSYTYGWRMDGCMASLLSTLHDDGSKVTAWWKMRGEREVR